MRSWSKWKIFSRKWKSSSSAGPRSPDPQRVLVVGDRDALLGGQPRPAIAGDLVRLAALPAADLLVPVLHRLPAVVSLGLSSRLPCSAGPQ